MLPLLGFLAEGAHMVPSMISEWMENGTMHDYMKTFAQNCIETCKMVRPFIQVNDRDLERAPTKILSSLELLLGWRTCIRKESFMQI